MEKPATLIAPYGSWKSPISASIVAGGSVGLDQICLDGRDLFWIEKRSVEGGRQVIVRLGDDGLAQDVTPAPLSARTRIHEYGGQSYAVGNGVLVFSNVTDGRLYLQVGIEAPRAITPEGPFRYGDLMIADGGSMVICVREDYGGVGEQGSGGAEQQESRGAVRPSHVPSAYGLAGGEPVDAIVSIDLARGFSVPMVAANDHRIGDASLDVCRNGPCVKDPLSMTDGKTPALEGIVQDSTASRVQVLVQGSDFYGAPRLSPDGRHLAWLAWNHPNMPWDGTELWLADMLADGAVGNHCLVAGGPGESVFQPEWSPDGILHFVSDRTGWWNLYRLRQGDVEALHSMGAEFGVPAWVLGLRTYDFAGPDRIACAFCENGSWRLALLDVASLAFEPIPLPYTHISEVRAAGGSAWFIASSPVETTALVKLDLDTKAIEVLRRSSAAPVSREFISAPQAIEFPAERGLTAHAYFFTPCNPGFAGPPGERPPLLVMCHGGPTDAVSPSLSLGTQFWTSRGFAVVQVNYGGSTGYGRAYRVRLNGQWGVVDVEDCVGAARYLVAHGLVDGDRMVIWGGSAGGYTALRALTLHGLFRAGAIYYGVSDLEMLAEDTPKFESRYHLRLVGPYPEGRDLYRARSPVHFAGDISAALIFFQGLDDPVVPPRQTEGMVRAVRAKGLPVACIAFDGEGHGFRRAETIRRALEAELYFYSRVFGFELAEPIEPVTIDNL
jgi:dipeptidyl aminopeptidase/acylaminoacyl peptidase